MTVDPLVSRSSRGKPTPLSPGHNTDSHIALGGGAPTDRCALDPQPDGRRYAACGDAVTVPVSEWIGRRLVANFETAEMPEATEAAA